MGTAVTAAVASSRHRVANEQAQKILEKQGQQLEEKKRRERENARYEAELHRQAVANAERMRQSLATWFSKYDADTSGLLERGELRLLLQDLKPDEAPPNDDVIDALIEMCSNKTGVTVNEIVSTVSRYNDYLSRKRELDQMFEALDRDGSGLLEVNELQRVMADLVPQQQVREADVAFLYGACQIEMGTPVPRSAMAALMPALAEWAKLARASEKQAAAANVDEPAPDRPTTTPKRKSSFCLVQ